MQMSIGNRPPFHSIWVCVCCAYALKEKVAEFERGVWSRRSQALGSKLGSKLGTALKETEGERAPGVWRR